MISLLPHLRLWHFYTIFMHPWTLFLPVAKAWTWQLWSYLPALDLALFPRQLLTIHSSLVNIISAWCIQLSFFISPKSSIEMSWMIPDAEAWQGVEGGRNGSWLDWRGADSLVPRPHPQGEWSGIHRAISGTWCFWILSRQSELHHVIMSCDSLALVRAHYPLILVLVWCGHMWITGNHCPFIHMHTLATVVELNDNRTMATDAALIPRLE